MELCEMCNHFFSWFEKDESGKRVLKYCPNLECPYGSEGEIISSSVYDLRLKGCSHEGSVKEAGKIPNLTKVRINSLFKQP